MATVEFKAHLDDDGGIVEYGLQSIVFDRYEMPDGPDVVVKAADRFVDEHLMLMSKALAGKVFKAVSIYVNGEYICALRQLNTIDRASFTRSTRRDDSLAEIMQNFAELTDEFNDFCDTMLEGFRG